MVKVVLVEVVVTVVDGTVVRTVEVTAGAVPVTVVVETEMKEVVAV